MSAVIYQPDLFGEIAPPAPKTREQEYQDYIRSPQWRRQTKAAKARAGYRCERCGRSHLSARLAVHHLTYERLGRERPEDLQVLCFECHQIADEERAIKGEIRAADALYEARLDGWATKVWGDEWADCYPGYEVAAERFYDWLEAHDGDW